KWLCGDQEAPKPEVSMLMEIAAAQHLIEVLQETRQLAGDDAGGNGEKSRGRRLGGLECGPSCAIAMSIDRCDIARTKDPHGCQEMDSKRPGATDAAGSAGQPDGVRELMVEQGFSLNAYVKDSLMLELYGMSMAEDF
uniref:SAM domain-containing protein n=1 Tax=Macrostomum lignano TaxID=282301 RepID=A0A1I8FKS5_9PLAT